MRESVFETLVGALILAFAGAFLVFAFRTGGDGVTGGGERYTVAANFTNVAGIERGSDVRLAGVKVGLVKSITLGYDAYEAELMLAIDGNLRLPEDTDARITADGLLGGSYIALEPGGFDELIPTDGTGEIIYTRGSVDLLTLVGALASGSGGDEE